MREHECERACECVRACACACACACVCVRVHTMSKVFVFDYVINIEVSMFCKYLVPTLGQASLRHSAL